MTQDEHWNLHYQEVLNLLTNQKRRPSKYHVEEHQMFNWLKSQKKLLARGKLKPERIEKFQTLLTLSKQYLRKNQYAYTDRHDPSEYCGTLFEDTPPRT